MISYLDAYTKILTATVPLQTESCLLLDSLDRICADSQRAKEQLPSFNNSAMDGFAIRSCETQNATIEKPLQLKVVSTIAAGDNNLAITYPTYSAVEIMTGAQVPDAYDAVLRVEDATIDEHQGTIQIKNVIPRNTNIRYIGEDFALGNPIITSGDIITSHHLMALAATGIDKIQVKRKPRISVITTGKELIDDYSQPLSAGKIRNSNMIYLRSIFKTIGLDINNYATLPDEHTIFTQKIKDLLNAPDKPDIIITTGAVSAGKWDFIPEALKALGAEIIFHKVAIRPGKPILMAKLDNTYIVGLPGNPLSMVVGFRFFIYPLLCALQEMRVEQPVMAHLQNDVTKPMALRCFYKAFLKVEQGRAQVEILQGQESFKISPLLKANCWAVLEENISYYRENELIKIYPLHPRHSLGTTHELR